MRLPRMIDGLAFRVALLLTIALVPIGMIAVSQTYRIAAEERRRAESAILALTAEAAASEESVMRAGSTVAAALASALPVVLDDPAQCSGLFSAFVRENGQYSFAGYVDHLGVVACGSAGVGRDSSGSSLYRQMKQAPMPRIDANRNAAISGTSVILLSQPVFDADGAFDGYVVVSLPNRRSFRNLELNSVSRPVDLVTFNDEGVVLSAEADLDKVGERLPRDRTLSSFVGQPRSAFTGVTAGGEARVFAVVPIIANTVYALGSWPVGEVRGWFGSTGLSPLLFPALMWLVSLGVAYMAVHRLAIRNITNLRNRMQRFIATRRLERRQPRASVPLEFRDVDETFADLAETVVREEAELENTIHGRTVLLKEVHHRVKNNLQLIASIVSMKIRKAATPEARTALKEVQMRVMSIATVHRALYTTSTVGRVQADELLSSIVEKTVEAAVQPGGDVKFESSYQPVSLYPDQAVPMSLLASEAVTNALKYVGRPADGSQPWIHVSLTRESSESAVLEIANSCGEPLLPPETVRGTGLGANLIRAFALQMRGAIEDRPPDGKSYVVRVVFPIVGFDDTPVAGELQLEDHADRPAAEPRSATA